MSVTVPEDRIELGKRGRILATSFACWDTECEQTVLPQAAIVAGITTATVDAPNQSVSRDCYMSFLLPAAILCCRNK